MVAGRLKLGEKREIIALDKDHIVVDERWRTLSPEPVALVRQRPQKSRNNRRWLTPRFGLAAGDTARVRITVGGGEVVERLVVEADGEALAFRMTVDSAHNATISVTPRGVRVVDGLYAGIGDPHDDKAEAFEQILGSWGATALRDRAHLGLA